MVKNERYLNEIPVTIRNIINEIQKSTDLDEFILYGGSAIDPLLKNDLIINDYDIIVRGKSDDIRKRVKKRLLESGFNISKSKRKYLVLKKTEVVLMYASNKSINLDICFTNNTEIIGLFNTESLYWKYPEMVCVDKYKSIRSIKDRNIKLTRKINDEDIYLLVSRFIYICSKYNIGMFDGNTVKILEKLEEKLNRRKCYKTDRYFSCVSSIFKSILKSEDRGKFVNDLVGSGLLKKHFTSLQESLSIILKDDLKLESLNFLNDKLGLTMLLEKNMNIYDRINFRKDIKAISNRTWDRQDSRLLNIQ